MGARLIGTDKSPTFTNLPPHKTQKHAATENASWRCPSPVISAETMTGPRALPTSSVVEKTEKVIPLYRKA